MFRRQKTGSVLCPSCRQLVGVNDDECLNCGRKRPGMWGMTGALRPLLQGDGLVTFLAWACGAVYLATLAADPSGIQFEGLGLLAPSNASMQRFGASGVLPVFVFHRWWTLLSAGWLHFGILHFGLNLMSLLNLGPLTASAYGSARTVLIYVLSSVAGFAASSVGGLMFAGYGWPLAGGLWTMGASASVFGLIGAILYASKRRNNSWIRDQAVQWIVGGGLFGFAMPGIDNWAHLGGLAGGYLIGLILDPLEPERGDHTIWAVVALAVSLGAVIWSLVVPVPVVRYL
jgi:rhomboid protease GluP